LNNNQELNVSNVNQLISLQPGEFRVYGNSQVALPVEDFDLLENSLSVYPNPATNSFKINQRVKQIEIYDHTGRLVRSFKGDFYPEQEYDVASLKPSMYFIRISTDLGSSSRRLIVE
jgi:hypothetical protein